MKHSILIASKSPELVRQIQSVLEDKYKMYSAASKKDAINITLDIEPAVCIADEWIEGATGFDFCGIIKNEYNLGQISFLMLTENVEEYDHARALLVGADDFTEKPLAVDVLLAKISNLVDKSDLCLSAELIKEATSKDRSKETHAEDDFHPEEEKDQPTSPIIKSEDQFFMNSASREELSSYQTPITTGMDLQKEEEKEDLIFQGHSDQPSPEETDDIPPNNITCEPHTMVDRIPIKDEDPDYKDPLDDFFSDDSDNGFNHRMPRTHELPNAFQPEEARPFQDSEEKAHAIPDIIPDMKRIAQSIINKRLELLTPEKIEAIVERIIETKLKKDLERISDELSERILKMAEEKEKKQ